MRPWLRIAIGCLFLGLTPGLVVGQAGDPSTAFVPRVLLVGDSIRLGYEPEVVRRLNGLAVVSRVKMNGGDSENVLKNLDQWLDESKPDVVHFNCGLHDLKRFKQDGRHQVELEAYETNLRRIVARIQEKSSAAIVFASTTPIIDARHAKRKADFDRVESDVQRYNAVALRVMASLGVPVNDLHWVVEQGGAEVMLGADGTHYTPEGSARLAEAVADSVLRQAAILRDLKHKRPAAGAESTQKYKAAETERDAAVPGRYREIKVPAFSVPKDAEAWKSSRAEVLKKVVDSLGDLPARPAPPKARIVAREHWPRFTLEKVVIDNGVDSEIGGLFLVPTGRKGPLPTILWLHSSSPDKNQILVPNTNGGETPLGEAYTQAGYAVFATDAYWHGERVGTGPSGAKETAVAEQTSLHKYHLWFGRTLWGMFVRDDQIALDYVCSRAEVDPRRIGATGISMGSTRAWWLAAVDERVAAVVGVACLTRYQNLIRHGELRAHGVYYFVNGLLRHFDVEGVLALIAPRPYLALTGELDAGSPADGIRELERIVGDHYRQLGVPDAFRSVLYPETGHVYTPEMRREMLAWFARWLKP